jgi:hypothetical protein
MVSTPLTWPGRVRSRIRRENSVEDILSIYLAACCHYRARDAMATGISPRVVPSKPDKS